MRVLIIVGLLAAGLWYYFKPQAPGKGPDAMKGMRISSGVMQAIESYRSARSVYPPSLDELVPEFLGGMPHFSNGSSLEYQRLGATYKLTFNYANPLPVHCSIAPGQKWQCEWF
jgi:hypothetical protein